MKDIIFRNTNTNEEIVISNDDQIMYGILLKNGYSVVTR